MKFYLRLHFFVYFTFAFVCLAWAQTTPTAERLLEDLGCANCHSGLPQIGNLSDQTPDLGHAGMRFNPAYLFDYLQNPSQVRKHLGVARMPGFHLDQRESLALALFLSTQFHLDETWSAALKTLPPQTKHEPSPAEARTLLTQTLNCTQCHKLGNEGHDESIDLATVGYRLQSGWLRNYLAAPYVFDGLHTKMPSYFYSFNQTHKKLEPMYAQAEKMLEAVASYLAATGRRKREDLQRGFEQAQRKYPEITAETGKTIYLSQNCAACHRNATVTPWHEKNAPDLSVTGTRVRREWLAAYLKKPHAIRPFGFYPGTGSRMPDFRLTDTESEVITAHLMQQKRGAGAGANGFSAKPLSLFAKTKAQTLLAEKLPCLGCHQLGEQGGRIGPGFAHIKSRLQPDFVYRFVRDPHGLLPEGNMPKILMPEKTEELILNFLLQNENAAGEPAYLSLIDNPLVSPEGRSEEERDYRRYCASCHGEKGDGRGYNAKFLPMPPTSHADAVHMSQRPDDTLFDGIYAGGYILNKSPLMPAWGQKLNHAEIRGLVAYLRQLCQCQGPSWSREGK